nr:hypothetical protein [Bacteroidota bacterium]
MKNKLLYMFLFIGSHCCGQNRNNIWCFGDSAGIDFNLANNPLPIHSRAKSRGSCASISDTAGNLQFYYSCDTWGMFNGFPHNNGRVFNNNHKIMQNGDKIITALWYWEGLILNKPADSSLNYLFTIGVTGNYGLYYSIIDMSLDSGRGAVTQKNIQLLPYAANDGLTAVKHGNGRDWWLIYRKDGIYAGWYDNRIYTYLISPIGINFVDSQAIGAADSSGFMRYVFNREGTKLAMVSAEGVIETFDFDRCTGVLSNHILIRPRNNGPPWPALWSCAFSPNSQYLYVSNIEPYSKVFQLDLQNPQPWLNLDTIYVETNYTYAGGALKLAPDGKIYYACAYYDGFNYNFPYPDTLYNIYNTHLSVINSPDSLGAACNFTPFSFYLGGARTYWGLPNNPDYDLGPLKGSPCDTLQWTNLTPNLSPLGEGKLYATYIAAWEKLFVNASGLKGKNVTVSIYDGRGSLKFEVRGLKAVNGYFTLDVDCAGWSDGLYVVHLSAEKERLSKKFIKE